MLSRDRFDGLFEAVEVLVEVAFPRVGVLGQLQSAIVTEPRSIGHGSGRYNKARRPDGQLSTIPGGCN